MMEASNQQPLLLQTDWSMRFSYRETKQDIATQHRPSEAGAADAKEPAALRVLSSSTLFAFSIDMHQKHVSQSAFAKQLSESALYKMYGSTSVS